MILLTSLTAVVFVLTLAATLQYLRHENIHTKGKSCWADVVHQSERPERTVEIFRLREQPTLLYHSLHNLYNKSK